MLASMEATSVAVDAGVDAALDAAVALASVEAEPPALVPTEAPVVAAVPDPAAAATADPASPAPSVPPPITAPAPEPAPPVPAEPATVAPAVAEPEAQEPDSVPVASQLQPVNVNVSVRIDSPGDNGAVTQENAAAVEVAPPPPSTGGEQYQPAPPQYQPPQTATEAPAAAPTPVAAPTAPVAAPTAPAVASTEPGWSWTWSCGDTVTHVLPPDVAGEILPANWSWNWNWNCGDDETASGNNDVQSGGQYHPGSKQYRPVNINVSIRIGSPGNDGSVTQTNVAIVVSPPALAISPLPLPLLASATDQRAPSAATPGATALTELVSEAFGVEVMLAVEEAETGDWIFRGLTGPHGVDPDFFEQSAPAARSPLAPASSASALDGPAGTYVPPKTSAWTVRAVAVTHAQASVRPDRPARAPSPRKPSRRPLPPMRAPVLASGFAGAAPGGTDGGGWPLLALLLVPFSLALVDSARRTVRVATLPVAAELRSRRERPG